MTENERAALLLMQMADEAADDMMRRIKDRGGKPIPEGLLDMMRGMFKGGFIKGYGDGYSDCKANRATLN